MKIIVLLLIVLSITYYACCAFAHDSLDQTIRERLKSPDLHQFAESITVLGDRLTVMLISQGMRVHDPEVGRKAIEALFVSGATAQLMKASIGRARPYAGSPWEYVPGSFGNSDHGSFPSGHTASAYSLAHILASYYPNYRYLLYATATLVVWSRIELDMHWPSDVLAGAFIGVVAAEIVLRLEKPLFQIRF